MMNISEIHWASQASYPILASLQIFPLLVMALIKILERSRYVYPLVVIASLVQLTLAASLYNHYDPHNSAMQLAEQVTLLGPFSYHAAIDGVSVLFILLTTVLSLMLVLYSHLYEMVRRPRFLSLLFLVESALISQFVTVDMLWFVLVSALQVLVVGYILWRWATSPERDLALARYLQFMGMGLLLFLVGIIMLGWNYSDIHGDWSFDLYQLSKTPIQATVQSIIFFLLFYGLAVRIPLFPLHGWLPLAAEHGMVAVAPILLLGLKTGVYGLIRFVLPLLPETVVQWHEYIMSFAVAGVFYAALLALMQVNLRRLLAFAVVSHTGILIIGLFSLNHEAFQGSVMLAINFGLAITGLLFTSSFIYARTGTLLISKLGGLFDYLPLFGITFFIAGLAIIGMPLTPGFDSFHLVLEASINRFGALVTVAAAVGNVVAAGFLLWAFQRAFLAPKQTTDMNTKHIQPANNQEKLLALMVIALLMGTGFYAEPWMDLIEQSLLGLDGLYDHVE